MGRAPGSQRHPQRPRPLCLVSAALAPRLVLVWQRGWNVGELGRWPGLAVLQNSCCGPGWRPACPACPVRGGQLPRPLHPGCLLPGNAQVSENQGRTAVSCPSVRITTTFQCRKPAPETRAWGPCPRRRGAPRLAVVCTRHPGRLGGER